MFLDGTISNIAKIIFYSLVSLELPEESSLKVAEIYLVNMYGEKV